MYRSRRVDNHHQFGGKSKSYPEWILSNEPQLKSFTRVKGVLRKGRLLFDLLPVCRLLEQIDRFFL